MRIALVALVACGGTQPAHQAIAQTHNVVFSLPGDADYSPLWDLHVYDTRAFSLVHDEATARRARVVKEGPLVNCPVVRWRHD